MLFEIPTSLLMQKRQQIPAIAEIVDRAMTSTQMRSPVARDLKISTRITLRNFCRVQFVAVTIILLAGSIGYAITKLTGHGNALGFLRLLNVGSEQSLPTYFSVINLLLASALVFVIFRHEKSLGIEQSGYWLFLSLLFLYLSVDESAGIHESFSNLHDYMVRKDLIAPWLDTHSWVVFGVLFVAVVVIILMPLIRRLTADTRLYFLAAATIFLTGALGFEYLGALMLEIGFVESKTDTAYLVRRLFEEGFEMYGVAIFNCAVYRELVARRITLQFYT